MKTFEQFREDHYRGTGEKVVARTKKWMDKKGQKGAPGLDAMKARTAEHKAKRGVKPEPGHRGMKPIDISKKVAAMRKEEVVTERLGGKGYKPYTSLTGKKVSGDWEDSDRGAGNKAKKRAGGTVKKKSPTYLAHVHNKEEVEPVNEGEYSAKAAMYQSGMTDASRVKGPVGKAVDKVKNVFKKKKKGGEYSAKAAMYMSGLTKEEVVTELNRYGKETGKATGSLNKRPGTPVKKGGTSSPVMRAVRASIRRETGRPEGQQKKEKGKKPPVAGEYGARRSPKQIVQNRRASKAAADASMRDTRGT